MNDCEDTIAGLYCSGDVEVAESWARGVQWELARIIYPDYRGGATIRPNYTQVVVDMIDERASLHEYGNPININNGSDQH